MNKFLLITSAGSSTRMGLGKKKEFLPLNGGTVLSQNLLNFIKSDNFNHIIITAPKDTFEETKSALKSDKELNSLVEIDSIQIVAGGTTRQESVFNGLKSISQFCNENSIDQKKSIVLVHDGARPFTEKDIIQNVISKTIEKGAAVPVINATDTQKVVNDQNEISIHLERKFVKAVQTPQGFELETLILCHIEASKNNKEMTDDSEIWDSFPELTGRKKVQTVEGKISNKKITYIEDLDFMNKEKTYRIGLGTDLHRLVEGRKLFLGGIEIPSQKGELAHSDGDVLLHAISDSLLGASGLGDIGSYFPPEDIKWKDADSKLLLKKIWADVKNKGWKLNNLDCVIEMEKPKFLPYRNQVIESIANILECNSDLVFVKAKTNEKVDAVGAEEAVKVYCTCLLYK